jgi:hypothetical protein
VSPRPPFFRFGLGAVSAPSSLGPVLEGVMIAALGGGGTVFGQRDDRHGSFRRGRCERGDKILDRIEPDRFAS